MNKDYYDILNIKRSATDEEISIAYKYLSLISLDIKNLL